MNYKQLVNIVNSAAIRHANVQEFAEGDIYEILNNSEHKYPAVVLTVQNISAGEGDTLTLNGTLFYIDRLLQDNSNKLEVQALAIQVLKQIQDKIEDELGASNIFQETYTPFTEKFADVCAGAFVLLQVSYIQELDCDNNFEIRQLTITEDGVYGTTGYDTVIVDVTKVRTIDGHSGDITLGKGLTINDQNVLSGVNPTFEQGENITITHTATEEGDNYRFDVPDMRYDDSIGAFNSMEKLNKYLYSIEYNTIDYNSAKEHFNSYTSEGFGHCSVLRKGDLFGRNYDYTINNQVEFILKTKAQGRLYSVTGIATAAAFTTDVMQVGNYIKDYLYLPFRLVDGINEKGLVCNVNELPRNNDNAKNISINGNTPELQERESIPMIMLVRYILDRFEKPIEAADYIKNYVSVKPIIGEDGQPMNFHFCIADKNYTVYLYFYGESCEYEVKNTGEDFVMTNFRLADTNLVDEHYSTTGSNIEEYGQGIERANLLIDFEDGDLLDYLYNTVNFTKAYTTDERLTEFAGIDGVTIDDENRLRNIQSDAAILYQQELEDGTLRTDADLWQTVHSVVYNLKDKTINLKIQEIENYNEIFTFNPYPRVEIEFTPDEIVPTTTNFVEGTTYSIYNALQRITNLFAGYWNYIQNSIMSLIPETASSTNQLADKSFVNETVAQNAANFRGNWVNWSDVPTDSNLYPTDYSGSKIPTNNDYMVVTDASDWRPEIMPYYTFLHNDLFNLTFTDIDGTTKIYYRNDFLADFVEISDGLFIKWVYANYIIKANYKTIDSLGNVYEAGEEITAYSQYYSGTYMLYVFDKVYDGSWRFLYTGDWATLGKSGWSPAYRIGSAFTDAQQAAIDSTITADKVNNYDGYESRIGAVETDKRDRIYTANKIYATDADGKDIALDLATIQAHNYASLTNKPTINGVEVVGDKTSADYKISSSCAQVTKTAPNITLFANELAIVESNVDVTVTLDNSKDLSGSVNEYRLQLTATAPIQISFTAPDLKWSYDLPDYLVNGKTYEISIINKHATYLVF